MGKTSCLYLAVIVCLFFTLKSFADKGSGNISVGIIKSGKYAEPIYDILHKEKGITPVYLEDLNYKTLSRLKIIVLPVSCKMDKFAENWMAAVRAFAESGFGILLLHGNVGELFPEIGIKYIRAETLSAKKAAEHPVTRGIKDNFEHTYWDHFNIKPGNKATILIEDKWKQALVVCGTYGAGKVLLDGMATGIGPGDKPAYPRGGESDILINGIKWLAEDSPANFPSIAEWNKITLKNTNMLFEMEKQREESSLKNAINNKKNSNYRFMWMEGKMPSDWNIELEKLKAEGITGIVIQGSPWIFCRYNDIYQKEFELTDNYLRKAIAAAHKIQMKVIYSAGHLQDVYGRLQTTHPELFMRTRNGSIYLHHARAWLCPGKEDVRILLKETLIHLIKEYDIDGICYDFIRFPDWNMRNSYQDKNEYDWEVCYCQDCIEKFKKEYGIDPRKIPSRGNIYGAGSCFYDTALLPQESREYSFWSDFRRKLVTDLVKDTSDAMRKTKPDIMIGAAVFPNPLLAKIRILQDWTTWADNKYIDFLFPMLYEEPASFKHAVSELRKISRTNCKLIPLIGAYLLKRPSDILKEINTCDTYADGFGIFAWHCLSESERKMLQKTAPDKK